MQLFLDFIPVIAFFVAYKVYDIYVATAVIIVAIGVQVAVQWIRHRKVSRMLLTSAALVFVFGGVTLAVRNEIFIQWKPTVINWLFALAFLGSQHIGAKPIVQRMLEGSVELKPAVWRTLNLMWVVYFFILGAANLYVVYNYDENTWVNFKLFGMIGMTLAFVLFQGLWIAQKIPRDQDS